MQIGRPGAAVIADCHAGAARGRTPGAAPAGNGHGSPFLRH